MDRAHLTKYVSIGSRRASSRPDTIFSITWSGWLGRGESQTVAPTPHVPPYPAPKLMLMHLSLTTPNPGDAQ
jgi:hypothetical protein